MEIEMQTVPTQLCQVFTGEFYCRSRIIIYYSSKMRLEPNLNKPELNLKMHLIIYNKFLVYYHIFLMPKFGSGIAQATQGYPPLLLLL